MRSYSWLPRDTAKEDGFWQCGWVAQIPLSEDEREVEILLGGNRAVSSCAPVFIEGVHVHFSNQSLVPCSKVSPVPPLTPGPPTLEINSTGPWKPRTCKASLTALYQVFCHPCPQYWLSKFRDVVNLLLTAMPLELLLNLKLCALYSRIQQSSLLFVFCIFFLMSSWPWGASTFLGMTLALHNLSHLHYEQSSLIWNVDCQALSLNPVSF